MYRKISLLLSLVSCSTFANMSEHDDGMYEVVLIVALIATVSMLTYLCAKALSYKQANSALNAKRMSTDLSPYTFNTHSSTRQEGVSEHKKNSRAWYQRAKKDARFCAEFAAYIDKNYSEQSLDIAQISHALSISERQLQRKVKAHFGQTTSEFIRAHRLNLGAEMLSQGRSVTVTALDVGFCSQNYFSQCFKTHFGMTPSEYISRL
ncbi:helix-turn-helix transcriptional regulator [Pseudoalteromonas sp. SMS1]|uniref:helix-turn-helix transcriptional regulator n=1 Tax=Pseudoalteromonas sp. SMS1 TaxID=2908894 RepID=UPI001F2E1D28|nr:helix-turn-helix transcriptional regulator [Pseudoalteromonas sp. SMS1]MCF2859134.1 helix-turn-helix transcriptional regulator [Pseudoalteromonas sp. SMS1]